LQLLYILINSAPYGGMLVPTLWHSCANAVAQPCQAFGTSVTSCWHKCVKARRSISMPDNVSQHLRRK